MSTAQPGILEPVPPVGRYLFFSLASTQAVSLRESLLRLTQVADGQAVVAGLGPVLLAALGASLSGLREFTAISGPGVEVPATPTALWCWLRGTDRGDLVLKNLPANYLGSRKWIVGMGCKAQNPRQGWWPCLVLQRRRPPENPLALRVGVKSGDLPTKFLAWACSPCGAMLADNSSRLHPNATPNNLRTSSKTRQLEKALAPALHLDRVLDAFRHGQGPNGHGRDLTGYEDGTENPRGEAAEAAALVPGELAGLSGSSFVAVQQWLHDFDAFEALSCAGQDRAIGRRRSDNEELEDAPASAHVKRTAQEDFSPQAFVLRRSMPWALSNKAGLVFVAFGKSFDAFEAQMRRMAGLDDGIVDALFRISRPVNGAYFWCPPVAGGRLDLRRLGL
ncbi:MAG: Dyp-type peroxidase [Polaromonas sp.]